MQRLQFRSCHMRSGIVATKPVMHEPLQFLAFPTYQGAIHLERAVLGVLFENLNDTRPDEIPREIESSHQLLALIDKPRVTVKTHMRLTVQAVKVGGVRNHTDSPHSITF